MERVRSPGPFPKMFSDGPNYLFKQLHVYETTILYIYIPNQRDTFHVFFSLFGSLQVS